MKCLEDDSDEISSFFSLKHESKKKKKKKKKIEKMNVICCSCDKHISGPFAFELVDHTLSAVDAT